MYLELTTEISWNKGQNYIPILNALKARKSCRQNILLQASNSTYAKRSHLRVISNSKIFQNANI